MIRRTPSLLAALLFAVAACASDKTSETCYSVDDVVRMCKEGVGSAVVVSAIQASGSTHTPSPEQIISLNDACADGAVIEALRGPQAAVAQAAEVPEDEAEKLPWLSLRVSQGSRGIEVFNTSGGPYTNLVLTANGEYTYRLPVVLLPGDGDYIRIASFKNRYGIKLDKAMGVSKLYIRADQGEYSKRF